MSWLAWLSTRCRCRRGTSASAGTEQDRRSERRSGCRSCSLPGRSSNTCVHVFRLRPLNERRASCDRRQHALREARRDRIADRDFAELHVRAVLDVLAGVAARVPVVVAIRAERRTDLRDPATPCRSPTSSGLRRTGCSSCPTRSHPFANRASVLIVRPWKLKSLPNAHLEVRVRVGEDRVDHDAVRSWSCCPRSASCAGHERCDRGRTARRSRCSRLTKSATSVGRLTMRDWNV